MAYDTDPDDGLPREIVGPWVRDKQGYLLRYVGISSSVRKKFLGTGPGKAGATYIELFCGPGRAIIENTQTALDGSPLCAWNEAIRKGAAFSQMHIADAEADLVSAAETRMKKAGCPVQTEVGPASETVDRIIEKLDPYALHVAFIDPYNLESLSFEIIKKLAKLNRMDILVHISAQDLQRNLKRYTSKDNSALDSFAPGWRDKVDPKRPDDVVRAKILEHWKELVKAEGMTTTETDELIVGTNNQRLYWLAFAARHDKAIEFWQKIRGDGQGQLF